MHAAVGDQPDEVDALGALQRGDQRLVAGERAVGDGVVDALEVLAHDRSRAEIEVTDLGVAHLPRRQADVLAAGAQLGVRVLGPQPVHDRRVGLRHGVALALGRQAPAVEDDEAHRRDAHTAAAATIAMKSSGSSDAPPTSPPSQSGSASSSPALSGFIEPP